jgi:nitrate reductase NapD
MTICSLVVYAKPEATTAVEKSIAAIEGVEIHAADPSGKLVVSIDHPDRTHCSETIMGFSNIAGVINTALVYEYYE